MGGCVRDPRRYADFSIEGTIAGDRERQDIGQKSDKTFTQCRPFGARGERHDTDPFKTRQFPQVPPTACRLNRPNREHQSAARRSPQLLPYVGAAMNRKNRRLAGGIKNTG